jgi:hypothetical protein
MSNSNEKLVAGIVALLPLARNALSSSHLDRQFSNALSNTKIQQTGSKIAHNAEKYVRKALKSNQYTRGMLAQTASKWSPLPVIALAVVGAGLIWAYRERRKANKASDTESVSTAPVASDTRDNSSIDDNDGSGAIPAT